LIFSFEAFASNKLDRLMQSYTPKNNNSFDYKANQKSNGYKRNSLKLKKRNFYKGEDELVVKDPPPAESEDYVVALKCWYYQDRPDDLARDDPGMNIEDICQEECTRFFRGSNGIDNRRREDNCTRPECVLLSVFENYCTSTGYIN